MKKRFFIFLLVLLLPYAFAQTTRPAQNLTDQQIQNLVKANNKIQVKYFDNDQEKEISAALEFQQEGKKFVLDLSQQSLAEVPGNRFFIDTDNYNYLKRSVLLLYFDNQFELILGERGSDLTVIGKRNGSYCFGTESGTAVSFSSGQILMSKCGVSVFFEEEGAFSTTDVKIKRFEFDESFILSGLKSEYQTLAGRGRFSDEELKNISNQLYGQIIVNYSGSDNADDKLKRHYSLLKSTYEYEKDFFVAGMNGDKLNFDVDDSDERSFSVDYWLNHYDVVMTRGDKKDSIRFVIKREQDSEPCASMDLTTSGGWLSYSYPKILNSKEGAEPGCGVDLQFEKVILEPTEDDVRVVGIRFQKKEITHSAANMLAGRNPEQVAETYGSLRGLNSEFNYRDIFDPVFMGSELSKLYTGSEIYLEVLEDGKPKDRYFILTANKKILYVLYAYKVKETFLWIDFLARDTTELGTKKPGKDLSIQGLTMDKFENAFDNMQKLDSKEISEQEVKDGGVAFQRQPDALQKQFMGKTGFSLTELGVDSAEFVYEKIHNPAQVVAAVSVINSIRKGEAAKDIGTAATGALRVPRVAINPVNSLRNARDLKALGRNIPEAQELLRFFQPETQGSVFTRELASMIGSPVGQRIEVLDNLYTGSQATFDNLTEAQRVANTFRESVNPVNPKKYIGLSMERAKGLGRASVQLAEIEKGVPKFALQFLTDARVDQLKANAQVWTELKNLYATSPTFRRGIEAARRANPQQFARLAEVLPDLPRLEKAAAAAVDLAEFGARANQVRSLTRTVNLGSNVVRVGSKLGSAGLAVLRGAKAVIVPAGPVGWAILIVMTGIDVGMMVYKYTATHTYAFDDCGGQCGHQLMANWDREASSGMDLKINFVYTNLDPKKHAEYAATLPHFSMLLLNKQTVGDLKVMLDEKGVSCDVKSFYSCLKSNGILEVKKIAEVKDDGSIQKLDPSVDATYNIEKLVGVDNVETGEIITLQNVRAGESYQLLLNLTAVGLPQKDLLEDSGIVSLGEPGDGEADAPIYAVIPT